MKTERNILIAFVLNLAFSIFEFFGGVFTGSIAIISDAVHDIGDAASIGISYFLEKKSKKQPDETYTYGYTRYSVVGSVVTTIILMIGSVTVIYNAIGRIISPTSINYTGMILFAIIGVFVNLAAAIVTSEGNSLNQKAVNLHMLEDVLGWIVVLIGAVVMRFTDFTLIDPIMSIAVAIFIFWNAFHNLKVVLDLFLGKTPQGIHIEDIRRHIMEIDDVIDAHHIHIWSLDGTINCATMHIVTNANPHKVKQAIRAELSEHNIMHSTLELEAENECCADRNCKAHLPSKFSNHHHHH